LWSVNGYLGNLSIEKSPVSIREPLSQMQIIFAVMIGIFIFGESLKMGQIFGIFLILLGGLVLVFKKEIFNTEFTKQSLIIIFTYTFITAYVAALDKYSLTFVPPYLYLFFNFTLPCIPLLFFGFKKHKHILNETISNKIKLQKIFYISLIFFIAYYLTLLCYKNFDFALIYPILKIATPITAISGIIFLNEKSHIERKIIAVILATAGAIFCKISF
jgi:drug/metabolite transporter (DMT)-like permease